MLDLFVDIVWRTDLNNAGGLETLHMWSSFFYRLFDLLSA